MIPTFNPDFGLNQVWQSTVAIKDRNMPSVADIDGDGISEIIVDANGNSSVNIYNGIDIGIDSPLLSINNVTLTDTGNL